MRTLTLAYTIVNAQLVSTQRQVVVDGAPATLTQDRTVIEAAPKDEMGKTFSAVLPADALADFPEDAVLTVTIEATAPADIAPTDTTTQETSTNG